MVAEKFELKINPFYTSLFGVITILCFCTSTICFLILYQYNILEENLCRTGLLPDCGHFRSARDFLKIEPTSHPAYISFIVFICLYQILNIIILIILALFMWDWKRFKKYTILVTALGYGALVLEIACFVTYIIYLIAYRYPFSIFVLLFFVSEIIFGILRFNFCSKLNSFTKIVEEK